MCVCVFGVCVCVCVASVCVCVVSVCLHLAAYIIVCAHFNWNAWPQHKHTLSLTHTHTYNHICTHTHTHHILYTHRLHIVCAHLLIMSPAILCCTFLSKRLDFIVHHVVGTPRIAYNSPPFRPLILPPTQKTLTPTKPRPGIVVYIGITRYYDITNGFNKRQKTRWKKKRREKLPTIKTARH